MRPYIGDGHDQTFYLAGEPGLYPACRFNGRLMAHHEAAAVITAAKDAGEGTLEGSKLYAEAMASRLRGWSYEDNGQWKPFDDHDGNKLPITAQTIGGLQLGLFGKLRNVLLGITPADVDPATGQAAKTPEANEKN